jgi:hypothetical protein
MSLAKEYKIVATPLNRDKVISFLKPPSDQPKGKRVRIIGQRPSLASEIEWCERLKSDPTIRNLMWRDHPDQFIEETTTDRIIPVEFILDDEEYMTRNLGGWSPVYFGLIEADENAWNSDPMLTESKVLTNYGNEIKHFGPDTQLIQSRLMKEFGTDDVKVLSKAIIRLHNWRKTHRFARSAKDMMACADLLYPELMDGGIFSSPDGTAPAVPQAVLIDELMSQLVRIELARRSFVANGDQKAADKIANWQSSYKNEHDLHLILKGEYVMGRQRRSTILIAGGLGIVAKQPGAEPFHEAKIGAYTHNGSPENWPVLTGNGAIVTPAGRMSLTIEQGLVLRLNHVFGHNIKCISALGFIIEPYVSGPTLQEYLLDDPSSLTPDLYEYVVLHQLICEELGVENGDWHSANFIVIGSESSPFINGVPKMIHIDWGAARPLKEGEKTIEKQLGRMNQVLNIGFSFQDGHLASEVEKLHSNIVEDEERLIELRDLAAKIVNEQ